MASQPSQTDTPHLTMQININGRGAFAAIALAALTAAQLPSLQARSAGGGYMGLMNPGRELWRFTSQEQADNMAGYTVPAGKELVLCGVAGLPWIDAGGNTDPASAYVHLHIDGVPFAGGLATTGNYQGPTTASWFPGLVVAEGSTLTMHQSGSGTTVLDSLQNNRGAFAYGYLRDI